MSPPDGRGATRTPGPRLRLPGDLHGPGAQASCPRPARHRRHTRNQNQARGAWTGLPTRAGAEQRRGQALCTHGQSEAEGR